MQRSTVKCPVCGLGYKWIRDSRNSLCDSFLCSTERLYKRFYKNTKLEGDCLVWTGALENGYGRFSLNGENLGAHRVAWKLLVGDWPRIQLNHLCENPPCVRVSHLRDVTSYEHNKFTFREFEDHICPQGHKKVFYPNKGKYGKWDCRVCNTARMRRKNDLRSMQPWISS